MQKTISASLLSKYLILSLCLVGKTYAAAGQSPIMLTPEEQLLFKDILEGYKKSLSTTTKAVDIDVIDTNPEQHIILPKLLTAEQIKEKNIFKRFKLTYTGTFPPVMERIISNIDDLQIINKDSQSEQKKHTPFCNGLLLYGEPGNGKTYFVEELSRVTQTKVLSCVGSQLHSSYKHLSTVKVENFFNFALKQTEPLIVFIDEVDAIAGTQSAVNGNNESTQTLKTFLIKLDELKKNKNVFVIVATNHPYWLEDAVKSRLPFAIEIERPKTWEEYAAFFKGSYKKHNLYDPTNSSDALARLVWSKAAYFLGGDAYSRRDLDTIIPIILDIKRNAYKKDKKYMHSYIRSISIDQDRVYIEEALKEVHLNFQKKIIEKKEKSTALYDKITEKALSAVKITLSSLALTYLNMLMSNEIGHIYQQYGPHFFTKKATIRE